ELRRHLNERMTHFERMRAALERAGTGDERHRPIIAEREIADMDVAGVGHGGSPPPPSSPPRGGANFVSAIAMDPLPPFRGGVGDAISTTADVTSARSIINPV